MLTKGWRSFAAVSSPSGESNSFVPSGSSSLGAGASSPLSSLAEVADFFGSSWVFWAAFFAFFFAFFSASVS